MDINVLQLMVYMYFNSILIVFYKNIIMYILLMNMYDF